LATDKYIEKNSKLVERCKQGDQKAQYEVYKLYSKAMYNICFRFLKHEGEAEDILQDAFVDAFTKIESFRQESSFGLWLKQIVVNKAINQLRTRRLDLVDLEEGRIVPFENEDDSYLCEEEMTYEVERVNKAIMELPNGYRAVLSLYLLEGYDHEEISEVLEISESTSRTQYMRGKKKLLALLQR
jgi:RNA polymerase sigma factor (sigma-70 family)